MSDNRTAAEIERDMIAGTEDLDADKLHRASLRERISRIREQRDEAKAAKDAEAQRQAAIEELRAEILSAGRSNLATLAGNIGDAVQEFRDACTAHNQRLSEWTHRARQLGVGDEWYAS